MSHFAKVEEGIVTSVIVAEQDFIDTQENTWVQTSYNTRGGIHYSPETGVADNGVALRKNYAGVGFTYDSVRDAFIPPQPYNSWTLNEDTCLWYPPVAYPTDGGTYDWNEDTISWVISTAWQSPIPYPDDGGIYDYVLKTNLIKE
jgi:hypothetical protein